MNGRPALKRRSSYSPQSPQEEFIVPLLKTAVEFHLDRLLQPAPPGRQLKLLDVGCGSQPFRAQIESRGATYLSLDVSAQNGCKIDFITRFDSPDLVAGVIEAGPYDIILCSEVLEHVAEWHNAFANFARLLAPDGYVVVSCPHFFPLHEEPYDYWRPTPHALRYFAEKHGLSVEFEEKLGSGWDVVGTILARQIFISGSRSLGSRILSRLFTIIRRLSFRWLRSRFPQRQVLDCGPYFLANFAVLQMKRSANSAPTTLPPIP